MKIVGKGTLHSLATGIDAALAGAVAALFAELSAARWIDADAAAASYPRATIIGNRIEIALPSEHCVVICVNYLAGVILVEFAGPSGRRPRSRASKGKRAL